MKLIMRRPEGTGGDSGRYRRVNPIPDWVELRRPVSPTRNDLRPESRRLAKSKT